ncbi:MAG: hypothetical protein QXT58_02170 [Archaeoglobaceae archaeon]
MKLFRMHWSDFSLKTPKSKRGLERIKVTHTLGCDPEFIFKRGELVVGGVGNLNSVVGRDGCRSVSEIRIKPSLNLLEFFYQVEFIMKKVVSYAQKRNFEVVAVPFVEAHNFSGSLGGHLHINMDLDEVNTNFVTTLTVELLSHEWDLLVKRRTYHNYGMLHDFRKKRIHDEIVTEVRFPSTFLYSPWMTVAYLASFTIDLAFGDELPVKHSIYGVFDEEWRSNLCKPKTNPNDVVSEIFKFVVKKSPRLANIWLTSIAELEPSRPQDVSNNWREGLSRKVKIKLEEL